LLPFFLQGLDSDVEPCQSDTIVKIDSITDLLVDALARSGDPFIAKLNNFFRSESCIARFFRLRFIIDTNQVGPPKCRTSYVDGQQVRGLNVSRFKL